MLTSDRETEQCTSCSVNTNDSPIRYLGLTGTLISIAHHTSSNHPKQSEWKENGKETTQTKTTTNNTT